jgi:hypothetical protein
VGQGLVTRCLPSFRDGERKLTGPPKFLGNPHVRVKVFDPGGTWHAKPFRHAGVAFCITTKIKGIGFRGSTFRGSIAQPVHSLSTLRRTDHSATTQDSLPVAGWLFRVGLVTHWVPMKGFRLHDFLLSQARLGALTFVLFCGAYTPLRLSAFARDWRFV